MTLLECESELRRSQNILTENGHMDNMRRSAFDVACELLQERHNQAITVLDKIQNDNDRNGRIIVKGMCFEGIIEILTKNGYDVQVTVRKNKNLINAEFVIDYQLKEEMENEKLWN